MPPHPLEHDVEIDSQEMVDAYLQEHAEIPITERNHAISDPTGPDELHTRLHAARQARLLTIHRDLFPDLPSIQIAEPVDEPCGPISRSSHHSAAPPSRNYHLSRCSSPVPSLDSIQLSVADSSLATDDAIASQAQQVFQAATEPATTDTRTPLRALSPSSSQAELISPLEPSIEPRPAQTSTGATSARTAPAKPFRCAFWFNGCRSAHRDKDRWLKHCTRHVRSLPSPSHPLPCSYCSFPVDGWHRWLQHTLEHESKGDKRRVEDKVDPALLPYLLNAKAVKDHEVIELLHEGRMNHSQRAYLIHHDAQREKRELDEEDTRTRSRRAQNERQRRTTTE